MPTTFYQTQAALEQSRSLFLQKRYNYLSWLRLLLFFGGIALLIAVGAGPQVGWLLVLLPLWLLGFGWFMRWHESVEAAAAHAKELARQAEAELRALDHDFSSWPTGAAFADVGHPYSADLDLFGAGSLYQLLCRSHTAGGQARLATWLLEAASAAEIEQRQAVVDVLASQPTWCHSFRATASGVVDDRQSHQRLLRWAKLPPLVADKPWLRLLLWVVPALFALAIYLFWAYFPFWLYGVLALLPAVILWRRYSIAVYAIRQQTDQMSQLLFQYKALLRLVETADWQQPYLQQLQSPLRVGKGATAAMRSLAYALGQLEVGNNPFAVLLELSGLWSLQWMLRLDRWRVTYGSQLADWLEAITALDALVSFANLRMNYPDWAYPVVGSARGEAIDALAPPSKSCPCDQREARRARLGLGTDVHESYEQSDSQKEAQKHSQENESMQPPASQLMIVAEALGHPLIDPKERITNDFRIAASGQIHLVTGSNMAGKSTWLRTVGINMVLALAGAPVCARCLCMPHLQVWTSMRTQDALQESSSSFFAELRRLKAIIDAVEERKEHVFFLLDEILKGTNSRDRHTGARALIRQLIRAQGAGLIATHDLELTALADSSAGQVVNYAMEVRLEAGELVFDYSLQPGVSQSFNATILMAQMGIAIDDKDVNLRHE